MRSRGGYAKGYVTRTLLSFTYARNFHSYIKRLVQTPVTSVASKRAFSSMNFLYSNNRNRLQPERVNKLLYIYVNQRTLRRQPIILAQRKRRMNYLVTAAKDKQTRRA